MDKQLTEVKRGEQASQVLDNPLFQESVEKVREGIIRSMATSPLGDSETHNRLVIAMQLLNQIEKQLMDVMQTGKMAAIQTDNKFKIFK
jgi:DNA-binding TFAR19-related protein (PDSD5 family)